VPTVWIIAVVSAYLAGSIPFGLLIARLVGDIDIREHGSKNIGATNVGRVLGRRWGLLCFVLDVLKGAAPVLVAGALTGVLGREPGALAQSEMWWWMAVAMAATLGHIFPVYIGFHGGKGVATGFGALAAMWPLMTLPAFTALVVWYATLRLTKYVSIASMLAASAVPACYALTVMGAHLEGAGERLWHASPPLFVTIALAAVVIWKHRANIARIRRGEEPRAGEPLPRPHAGGGPR
jgi:acyl phosphate:glycerol-3-phosphate acyltransferase